MNPFGQVILVSQDALRALDMRGYLRRDDSGLKGMDATRYLMFLEAERGTRIFKYLGEDCSGPNVVVCNCEDCKAKIADESDLLINDIRTRQVVRS